MKFARWYHSQNETTRAWLDAQAKQDDKLLMLGVCIGFLLGSFFTFLIII